MLFLTIPYGLPWLGALAIRLLGERHERVRYALAIVFHVLTGISTPVILFLIPDNLDVGGFSIISAEITALLNLILAGHLVVKIWQGSVRPPGFYALLLLLIGGVNGIALAQLMPIIFISWGMVVFAASKVLWYGGVVRDVSADMEERRNRDRDDFYDSH